MKPSSWTKLFKAHSTPFRFALQAIRRELLDFRLDYPINIIDAAGEGNSLHYYVWSNSLFLENLVFDARGVAMKQYRAQGPQYNPLFVAWWGLFNLEQHVLHHNEEQLQRFIVQVAWLRANAVRRDDGAIVWPCYFDWQEGF